MSIQNIDIENFKQNFDVLTFNKNMYGEVHTDFKLIYKMFHLFDEDVFKDKNKKWLDPCCGRGYFCIILYKKLFEGLKKVIKNPTKRHKHIIENMIFMAEINEDHTVDIYELFGENCNLFVGNFLDIAGQKYDYIIGNPPFNVNGMVKVPTRQNINKKSDGKMIWAQFVLHAFSLMKPTSYLLFITPSIWMKRDHFMYQKMLQYNIEKLVCLTNTQTNQIFHGQAQTPTCYWLLKKEENINNAISIYDDINDSFIYYDNKELLSFPLIFPTILKKIKYHLQFVESLIVKKTNMPSKLIKFSLEHKKNFPHRNINTCVLKEKIHPTLVFRYSDKKCKFADIPKLVLAHKMYGFPYYDKKGEYGISNRDNYVITGEEVDLLKIKSFLSTKTALCLFEATRYRMKYLEKYIFEMIPNIARINDFPETINDETIADFFLFSEKERKAINDFHKKPYLFFNNE